MDIESKSIKKMNLKECRAALRKLKRNRDEIEDTLWEVECDLNFTDDLIDEAKERIKKLTPKK